MTAVGARRRVEDGAGFEATRSRVLIADRDAGAVAVYGAALRRAGFEIVEVVTEAELLDRVRRTRHALCVVDLAALGARGDDALTQLGTAHQPFMVLDARADAARACTVAGRGAVAYLVKPGDPAQLIPPVLTAAFRGVEMTALRALAERRAERMEARRVVDVAAGLLMAQRGMTHRTAFEALRQHARRTRRPLTEVASEIAGSAELMYGLESPTQRFDRTDPPQRASRRSNATPRSD